MTEPKSMAQEDKVHVAVAPPKMLDADLVKQVASVIHKEIYDTRLLLAGEIPRIINHYPSMETAESVAHSLRALGLVAFICKDSELRNRPPNFRAHSIKFKEREAYFWDKHGGQTKVEAGEIFLIIKGRRQSFTQEETTTTKMKLNVPVLLATGIPVVSQVTQRTTKESLDAESFARLYDRKSPNPCVEILQNHTDYAFLGPELVLSTPENFKIVVTKLRELLPQAVLDERLTKPFKTDVPAGPEEALEINCKLIYLYHWAVSAAS
jgi:hypothetical protein